MATVNVPCGNCGTPVAVEEESLGTPVHCPQCQHVVQSPAATPPPPTPLTDEQPPEITLSSTPAEEHESIFSTPEQVDDALFGSIQGPTIEMPADPAGPPPAAGVAPPPPTEIMPSTAAEPDSESIEAAAPWISLQEPSSPTEIIDGGATPALSSGSLVFGEAPADTAPASTPSGSGLLPTPGAESGTALPAEPFPSAVPRRPAHRGLAGMLFIALVLIPLISYSILATIAVVVLYMRQQPVHPLEALPDLEGDYKGAKHQKQGAISYERVQPETALPDKLLVPLGKSIRLGDVEVTPQKVELAHIKIRHPGFPPEPQAKASLVLHLRLENISQDVVFCPADPYFDRRWKTAEPSKPYTFLEMGSRRFFGGPLLWKPDLAPEDRETVEGQQYKMLQPGESLTTLVCTDPDDEVRQLLANYRGHLLWRVQVRRGLVKIGEREIPATAVIGVPFEDKDIEPET